MQKRERTFLQAPTLPFHFWFPLLSSRFCPFVSNAFSYHLLLLKQKKKKNRKEEKKCKEGRGLTLKRSFCPFTFGSHFWSPVSALLFQALSPCHLLLLK
jgi:hypothetical protein